MFIALALCSYVSYANSYMQEKTIRLNYVASNQLKEQNPKSSHTSLLPRSFPVPKNYSMATADPPVLPERSKELKTLSISDMKDILMRNWAFLSAMVCLLFIIIFLDVTLVLSTSMEFSKASSLVHLLQRPRWSAPPDQEILDARRQIQNAPIAEDDRELHAPAFWNLSAFKRWAVSVHAGQFMSISLHFLYLVRVLSS